MNEKMRIGELAELAGVTTRTIRYYESLGFFGPSEREGKGFRYYSQHELDKLHKIDAFKQMGLTLEEIKQVIPLYFEDPTGLRGKQKTLQLLKMHLKDVDEKIASLHQLRHELETNITQTEEYVQKLQSS